jgi:NAD(P)-dependent dehydrogenase (short-subunit alcohol dehydrogenase family)
VVANSRTITESPHPEVIAVPGDIADPATAEQLVAEAVTRFGHVGTLVVQLATQTDAVVAEQFISVVGMIDSPACLLRPAMVIRILKAPGHRHTQRSTARLSSSKACVEK